MIGEKKLRHGCGCGRHIPPEIMEEILSKLPPKSLNRFRSVSTSWQSLISSHRFIMKHLINAESKLFQKPLIHHEHLNTIPSCYRPIPNIPNHPLVKRIVSLLRTPSSCHGFICVENATAPGFLSVWNPGMRIFKSIRHSMGIHLSILHSMGICFGIGYDATRDDYIIMKLSRESPKHTTKTEIYSLKSTDSCWTRADDFPGDIYCIRRCGCESVYQDGAIHWLETRNPRNKSIFSFDLSTNKYKGIPLPEFELINGSRLHQIRLAAFRGMLYVLVNDTSGLILWALKEDYRDQSSWIRLLQIPSMVFTDQCLSYFKLFYVYENGEFLIGAAKGGETEMMICKDNQIVLRQRTSHHHSVVTEGIVQVESLASRAIM